MLIILLHVLLSFNSINFAICLFSSDKNDFVHLASVTFLQFLIAILVADTGIPIAGSDPGFREIELSFSQASEILFSCTTQQLGTRSSYILLNLDIEFKRFLYF